MNMDIRRLFVIVVIGMTAGCGLSPQRVSLDDPKIKPLFEATTRVNRMAMGFTPIPSDVEVRVEWGSGRGYDAMLHIQGKTDRTIAFKRAATGYQWIGEQEVFQGPNEYDSMDGRFKESIAIIYERIPISGYPLDTVLVIYHGREPELTRPRQLSLEAVRPWLERWGYD